MVFQNFVTPAYYHNANGSEALNQIAYSLSKTMTDGYMLKVIL